MIMRDKLLLIKRAISEDVKSGKDENKKMINGRWKMMKIAIDQNDTLIE